MAKDRFDSDAGGWSRNYAGLIDEMLQRRLVAYRDSGAWQPATNVYESPEAFLICVELSGVTLEGVQIELPDPSTVVIRGRREQPRPRELPNPWGVHILEIDEGPFFREIALPAAVDASRMLTEWVQGLLWLTIPKTAI